MNTQVKSMRKLRASAFMLLFLSSFTLKGLLLGNDAQFPFAGEVRIDGREA